jgi:hypothetical protein
VANWYSSADETAEALADLFDITDINLPTRFPGTAVLLTDADGVLAEDRQLHPDILTCAGLLDFKITGYAPSDYRRAAWRHVTESPPSVLIVADQMSTRCADLVAAYRAASDGDSVFYLLARDVTSLVLGIRRRLIAASGVSHGLFPLSAPVTEPTTISGRLPIEREGRKFRHVKYRAFVECEVSGFFYSIDLDGHGGSVFKRFTETVAGLQWSADLDQEGRVIEGKHKGAVGLVVPWDELHAVPQKPRERKG